MEYEIYHHGTKGMRWGIRRYQNKDGSLTAAGRKRYTNKDGSLNERGKKYVAKEEARLKAEKAKLKNQQRTDAKLNKLDEMRKKINGSDDSAAATPKKKPASEMNDKELQDKVNRLRNEDAYNDLSKKLGYDGPATELDAKIAGMKKQKEYLELQRDINNLTPQKVSLGKKLASAVMSDIIAPAATKAGKEFLTNYLSQAGQKKLTDTLKKETDKIDKKVEKAAEKAVKQEAKKQEKQQAKIEKQMKKAESVVDNNGNNKAKSNDFDSNYEKRVDKMLEDIDTRGWELYYDVYARNNR